MKNDSKGGSTNAFQHVLGCCPELLPAPLLLEALLLARGKVEATLSKWCIRAPAPSTGEGANVLAHVRAEVRALSAPSNLMRPDMPFRTKLNMLADAVAEGTAASGMPLNAVSSELVGSIVRIFGPKCPIPGPHMIAARVRPLYAETTKDLSVKLCRIIDDSSVGLASIFKPPTVAHEVEFVTVELEDDGCERDLLPVVLDALSGDDADLEIELELDHATDAVDPTHMPSPSRRSSTDFRRAAGAVSGIGAASSLSVLAIPGASFN